MGQLSADAGRAAFDAICAAVADAQAGTVHAVATAPVNKLAFSRAGLPWKGHTDLLAHLTSSPRVAMMFWSEPPNAPPSARRAQLFVGSREFDPKEVGFSYDGGGSRLYIRSIAEASAQVKYLSPDIRTRTMTPTATAKGSDGNEPMPNSAQLNVSTIGAIGFA